MLNFLGKSMNFNVSFITLNDLSVDNASSPHTSPHRKISHFNVNYIIVLDGKTLA